MREPAAGTYQTRIATRPDGTVNMQWPVRSPFYTHSMVGGNAYLLELLRDNRVALEIGNSTTVAGFDEKITETRAFLSSSVADLGRGGRPNPLFPAWLLVATAWLGLRRRQPGPHRRQK